MKLIRQRYILFEFLTMTPSAISEEEIMKAIWNQIIHFFGEFSTYRVGLWMIRYDPQNHIGILRCDNISKTRVISALALIRTIKNISVIFHTRYASGTIKKTLKIWKEIFQTPPPFRKTETKD